MNKKELIKVCSANSSFSWLADSAAKRALCFIVAGLIEPPAQKQLVSGRKPVDGNYAHHGLDSRSLGEIARETEVWVADSPSHLIHFDGERFLGPYSRESE